MINVIKLPIITSIVLILSGCGTVWVHNSKGESEWDKDKSSCRSESRIVYPKVYSQPVYQGETTKCRKVYNDVKCTSTPKYSSTYDINKRFRSDHYDDCLVSKGWREEEKDD
jgi:hypothetical protein